MNKLPFKEKAALRSAREAKTRDPEKENARHLAWRTKYPEKFKNQRRTYLATVVGRAGLLWRGARRRAAKQGTIFSITLEEVQDMLWDGVCQATGLPFDMTMGKGRGTFSPSIDRIVSAKGYVTGNTRAVIWAFNAACGPWGEEILWQVVKARWPDRLK